MEVCDLCHKEVASKALHWLECEKIHGVPPEGPIRPEQIVVVTGLDEVKISSDTFTEEQKMKSTCNTIKNLDPDESCVHVTWADDPTPQYLDIPTLKKIVEDYENHRL